MRDNTRNQADLDGNSHHNQHSNSKAHGQRKQEPTDMMEKPHQLKSLNRQKVELPSKLKKLSPIEKKNVLPRIPRRADQSGEKSPQPGGTKQQNNVAMSRQATIAGINRQKPQGHPADLGGRQATVTGIVRQHAKREKGASNSNFMIDNANYARFSRYVNGRLCRTRRVNMYSSKSKRCRDNIIADLNDLQTNSQSLFQDKQSRGAANQTKEERKWKY